MQNNEDDVTPTYATPRDDVLCAWCNEKIEFRTYTAWNEEDYGFSEAVEWVHANREYNYLHATERRKKK